MKIIEKYKLHRAIKNTKEMIDAPDPDAFSDTLVMNIKGTEITAVHRHSEYLAARSAQDYTIYVNGHHTREYHGLFAMFVFNQMAKKFYRQGNCK